MLDQKVVRIQMGPEVLLIEEDLITVKKVKEMRAKCRQVQEEYDAKILELQKQLEVIGEKYKSLIERRLGPSGEPLETDQEYKERSDNLIKEQQKEIEALMPKQEEYFLFEMALASLKVLGECFGQVHKVTEANFELASWPKLKLQLATVLIANGCDLGTLFLPPKLTE